MRIGRYSVVSLLGHGAFGEVFHARLDGPMGFRKDVAIKRLHPHLVRGNAELVQALVDEARIGGLLRHPNIVEIHEFEHEDGAWFLAMEFVEQLCRGLAHAHAVTDSAGHPLRIVHRDLKPANLMISRPRRCIPRTRPEAQWRGGFKGQGCSWAPQQGSGW